MNEVNKASTPKMLSNGPKRTTLLVLVFFVLVSCAAGFVGGWFGAEGRQQTQQGINSASQQIVSGESQLISQIAKDVSPSVVSIDVTSQATTNFGFFGPRQTQQQSAGTGVIISSDGVIITNRHVVPAGTTSVSVTLSNGTKLDNVSVIGKTADGDSLDVAFLKIKDAKGEKLKAAKIGDSSKMQVGDKVIAIGNALGQFQNTVTAGIISGYGRSVEAGDATGNSSETLQDLFQTDAAINEGNSGGPLVNISSEVIAINTAIAGGQAQNIGFAIPVGDLQGLIKSVLTKGKLERPYLGVHYVNLTDDLAYQNNLTVKRGAYIIPSSNGQSSIIAGSPAAKANLKDKDIIIKIDNDSIDENHSLVALINKHSVGDEVTLTIVRDGKQQTIKTRLEASPSG